jgi:hypothetical protein
VFLTGAVLPEGVVEIALAVGAQPPLRAVGAAEEAG